MPSKPSDTALRDILHHIELANRFVEGFDQAKFEDDTGTIYAVTRCLEIISEVRAVCRMGAGNVYRHDYEDVAARYVWDAVQLALSDLRRAIEHELKRLG